VDLYIVAPAVVHGDDFHHGAGVRSVDGRSRGGGDVHAAVVAGNIGVRVGPAADAAVVRHRPDEGAGAQLADHAAFEPGAAADDLRRGGLLHLHRHHPVVDQHTVFIEQPVCHGLAAGHARLDR